MGFFYLSTVPEDNFQDDLLFEIRESLSFNYSLLLFSPLPAVEIDLIPEPLPYNCLLSKLFAGHLHQSNFKASTSSVHGTLLLYAFGVDGDSLVQFCGMLL